MSRQARSRICIVVVVGSTVVACADGAEPATRDDPSAPGSTLSEPTTVAPTTGPNAAPQPVATELPTTTTSTAPRAASSSTMSVPGSIDRAREIDLAIADLAAFMGYDPDEVGVASVESVTWRDAALGCPATGVTYDQTPVAGYRIVLTWQDLDYHFHGADGEAPRLCQFLD